MRREQQITKEFLELQGAFELILSGASISERGMNNPDALFDGNKQSRKYSDIIPSENAKKEMIFDVS